MKKVLIINHHSTLGLATTTTFDESKSMLDAFFRTWQLTVKNNVSENFVVCDTDIWSWNIYEDKTMHDYIESHNRTNSLFIYQLLKVTKRTSLNYFYDDILEIIQEANAFIEGHDDNVFLIGCTSMTSGASLLSLATNDVWKSRKIKILWHPSEIKLKYQFLPNHCDNFSAIEHVSDYISEFESLTPITKEKFGSILPSAITTDKFWSWFEKLEKGVQEFLTEKACFCAAQGWIARRRSPFQSLVGTKNSLTEIRAWPLGKTLRIYTKKESDSRVIFLAGSDKDGQDEMIASADEYYSTHKEKF